MANGSVWMSVTDDGEFSWERCPGWEGYRLSGRASLVKGKPAILAIRVEPLDAQVMVPLSGVRLNALPLAELAVLALEGPKAGSIGKVGKAMRSIVTRAEDKHDPRAVVTVEQVAAAWHVAHAANFPERNTVAAQLNSGRRTADRYIARARSAGLIPADRAQQITDGK